MTPLDIFCFKKDLLYGSEIPKNNEDIAILKKTGIKVIISLSEEISFYHGKELAEKFQHYQLFFEDGYIPSIYQTELFLKILRKHIQKKEPILIHCLAGCGRTGLMLAVAERFIYGSSAEKAIRKVRQSRPCAIENSIQEEFVRNYKRKNFHLSLLKKILTRK